MPTLDEYMKDDSHLPSKNIKDPQVFSTNFLPPRIYERKELFRMADIMKAYIYGGLIEHIVISGPRGYGKTVSARYALSTMEKILREKGEKSMVFSYISCHQMPTTYSALRCLMNAKEGVHKSTLYQRVGEFFAGRRGIVVLDEADHLRDHDILYLLTRNTELQVICIARSSHWYLHLDESIQSTLQPRTIVFGKYKPDELVEILRQRAEMGLYHYDEQGIKILASLTIQRYNGDVRFAISALRKLGEKDKWDEKSILDSLAEGIEDIERFTVEKLPDDALLILGELIKYPDGIRTSDLYLKVKNRHPMVKSTFFSALGDLEKDELIRAFGKGQGRAYFIAPTIHNPNIVLEEIEKRSL